jgi:hypothetical protein
LFALTFITSIAALLLARSSRTTSSSNDPKNQQAVTLTLHDALMRRPCLFLSKRAVVPLTVICQVRWRGG